jgi:hypothetical protein
MKQAIYSLIALTLWCQFDDVLLTPAAALQYVPVPVDDDDEYLAPACREHQELVARLRQPAPVSVKRVGKCFAYVGRGMASERNATEPLAFSSLHVFMSLQI